MVITVKDSKSSSRLGYHRDNYGIMTNISICTMLLLYKNLLCCIFITVTITTTVYNFAIVNSIYRRYRVI